MKNTTRHNLSAERNNGKKVFATPWQICVFVTDSKIYQSLNLYLKKYQNESLDKGFIRQIHLIEQGFTNAIQNTHSKLVLTKVNFGSKFV